MLHTGRSNQRKPHGVELDGGSTKKRSPSCTDILVARSLLILMIAAHNNYRETSNIRRALGKKLIDHSDVVGALPVGTAPTTSSFST